MNRLLIISGESGAGKTTLASQLQRQGRGYVINAGDVVWDVVTSAGLKPASRIEAGLLFIEYFGPDALAPVLQERLVGAREVIVDGLRLPETWTAIFQMWPGCSSHIHIDVPMEVRQVRLLQSRGIAPLAEPFHDEIHWLKQKADLILHSGELSGVHPTVSRASSNGLNPLVKASHCHSLSGGRPLAWRGYTQPSAEHHGSIPPRGEPGINSRAKSAFSPQTAASS